MLLPIIRTVSPLWFWGVTTYVFVDKKKNYLWNILNTLSYLELWFNLKGKNLLCEGQIVSFDSLPLMRKETK